MGLHEGIGLKYMLEHIKPYIYQNDIVLLIPEYGVFFDGTWKGERALAEALSEFPEGLKYVTSFHQIDFTGFLRAVQLRMQKFLKTKTPLIREVYNRKNFNKNGDNIGHLDKPIKLDKVRKDQFDFSNKIDRGPISLLNQFYKFCQEKDIKAFLSFPPIPKSQYEGDGDTISKFYTNLGTDLHIPIISSPDDYIYPIGYFYDTGYHLNAIGRKIRTQMLIADIQNALAFRQVTSRHYKKLLSVE